MAEGRVAILGAGTMGHGIAQVAAQSGYETRLYDVDAAAIERGLAKIRETLDAGVAKGKTAPEDRERALARLAGETSLEEAVQGAALVVEAAPERMDLKRTIFTAVSRAAPADAILGTNTSSLPVSEIARAAADPSRVIGLHFFNPPHLMKLLEIVRAEQTSDETLRRAKEMGAAMGREMIVVRDSPGFATSRLGLVIGLEAMRMFESGVASAQDIDRAMELGYRHPMGPLKLTDLVGLDVRLAIAEHLHRELGETFRPPEILRTMVREGKLGKKAGQGFYTWD